MLLPSLASFDLVVHHVKLFFCFKNYVVFKEMSFLLHYFCKGFLVEVGGGNLESQKRA